MSEQQLYVLASLERMAQLMNERIDKFKLIFILMTMTIVMMAAITHADSALAQSDPDIPSDWAKAEIDKAKEIDLLPEKLQGKYASDITREEFSEVAVKLYEALSGKKGILPEENPFTDTQSTDVITASALGIVQGGGDGEFEPDGMITRQEISVMLYRTLQAAKPEYNYSDVYEYIFEDYNMISSWARDAVGYLYSVGVINGVGDNLFNPGGNTTAEEAIILAKRMHDKVSASNSSLAVSRSGVSRRGTALKLKLEELIAKEMGKPYKWGGMGPNSYDCSGLVYSLFGKLGISLPRVASSQAKAGTYVARQDLTYGDLVFFARNGKTINHVGIYVGNGEFVHAPQAGDVVKKTAFTSGYYEKGYYTGRRVIN